MILRNHIVAFELIEQLSPGPYAQAREGTPLFKGG